MQCPRNPLHGALTKRGMHHECQACELMRFKTCISGADNPENCKGLHGLQQAARDAINKGSNVLVPNTPLMLYARPGGVDKNARLYGEKTPVFRINDNTSRCKSCLSESFPPIKPEPKPCYASE